MAKRRRHSPPNPQAVKAAQPAQPVQATTDVSTVADRAGRVIRDQITSMVEAAEGSAANIERKAHEDAERNRVEAHASAERVRGDLIAVERELNDLLRDVSRQGDRLRVVLSRAAVRAKPTHEALSSGDEEPFVEASSDASLPAPDLDSLTAPVVDPVDPDAEMEQGSRDPAMDEPEKAQAPEPGQAPGEESVADEVVEPVEDEPDRDEPDRDEPDRDEPDRDEPDGDEPVEEAAVEDEGAGADEVAAPDDAVEPVEEEPVAEGLVEDGAVEPIEDEAVEHEAFEGGTVESIEDEGLEPVEDEVAEDGAEGVLEEAAEEPGIEGEPAAVEGPAIAEAGAEDPGEGYEAGERGSALSEDDLLTQARSSARDASDAELAEMYDMATTVGDREAVEQPAYREALAVAVVDEAASRPDFGMTTEEEPDLSRRKRKQRDKAIGRLRRAVESRIDPAQD